MGFSQGGNPIIKLIWITQKVLQMFVLLLPLSIQTTHIFGCCGNSTRFPFPPPPIHSCSHGSILLCLVSVVFWARLGLPASNTHRTENMKLRLFLEVQTTKLDGMGNLLLSPHLINPINNYLQIVKLSPLGCTQLPPQQLAHLTLSGHSVVLFPKRIEQAIAIQLKLAMFWLEFFCLLRLNYYAFIQKSNPLVIVISSVKQNTVYSGYCDQIQYQNFAAHPLPHWTTTRHSQRIEIIVSCPATGGTLQIDTNDDGICESCDGLIITTQTVE